MSVEAGELLFALFILVISCEADPESSTIIYFNEDIKLEKLIKVVKYIDYIPGIASQ